MEVHALVHAGVLTGDWVVLDQDGSVLDICESETAAHESMQDYLDDEA